MTNSELSTYYADREAALMTPEAEMRPRERDRAESTTDGVWWDLLTWAVGIAAVVWISIRLGGL
jgi:hypothetical protein